MNELIVEDGSALADADAYVSLADALTYHDDHANDAWGTATDDQRRAAIRNATLYIDGEYASGFPGTKLTRDQGLQWPRASARDASGFDIPEDEVPREVVQATTELALRALTEDLFATPEPPMKREKLGTAYEAEWDTTLASTTRFAFLGSIFAPLMDTPSGGGVGLVPLVRG